MRISTFQIAFIAAIAILSPCHAGSRVFHVAPHGDDSSPGSRGKPWRTLAHAASKAVAGTTIVLMDGTYRETLRIVHSGTPRNPVIFTADPEARPVISALDTLVEGRKSASHIEFPVSWDLGPGRNQLFLKGVPLTEARHPNHSDFDPMSPGWETVRFDGTDEISADVFRHSSNDHWKGAWFFGHGSKAWATQCARVSGSSGSTLRFDLQSKSSPWFAGVDAKGDPNAEKDHPTAGFIFGLPQMLDAPGEWFWNKNLIRLIPPAGISPAKGSLEAKRREWTVDLSNKNHVVIRGIGLAGGAVRLAGSNNRIENCSLRHASHFLNFASGYSQNGGRPEGSAIDLGGTDSTVSHCTVSMTAGCGILVRGQRNEVTRCLVEDIGYAGTYGGGITIAGSDASVTFNTVRRTGRDCIHFSNTIPGEQGGTEVLYNDCSLPGRICKDVGLLYVFGRNAVSASGRPTRIAWNWFHDHTAPRPSPGIYIDNYCRNFLIHHNVIWNVPNDAGIRINGPSDGCRIFNNTLFGTHDVGSFTYRRFETDNPEPSFWKSREHYFFESTNNLFLAVRPESTLTNPANNDFTLKPGSPAIDAGEPMSSPDVPVSGKNPDLGAYESGLPAWKAGHRGHRPGEPVARKTR